MNIQVIIPAHLNSIRLKRKVLININGLPMIEHVRRRVLLSKSIDKVHIATGDIEIKNIVENYGGDTIFTKKNHINGTSRISEAVDKINCTHVILVQGDEPLLIPPYIDIFVEGMKKSKEEKMWNAVSRFEKRFVDETSIVKCFLDINDNIIVCFRTIPSNSKTSIFKNSLFKIQGLIGYEKNFLKKLVSMNETPFEKAESIEQMRAIEYGNKIKAIFLPKSFSSVNNLSELKKVKQILNEDLDQIKFLKKIK
tara:strand:+ start:12516 stop:13274 length:759 start_codon:yes stop_codon:yes gene_type:complete